MYYTGTDGKPYPAEKNVRTVGGQLVTTWTREIVDCNILEVEVGTNGYQGGDTGHGGRTYVRIKDKASTDLSCSIVEDRLRRGGVEEVEITLGGDSELATFKEALRWILSILEVQSEKGE